MAEKDMELASNDKDLASWAAEATRMQEELKWESEERRKAQAEAAEAEKMREEIEKVAVEAQASVEQVGSVRKYLMVFGIQEIVAKIFASDDYVFKVAGLVPKLQAKGRVKLLEELRAEYFPDKDIKDMPGYMEGAVDISNAAFTEMQKGPKECGILDQLAARPKMDVVGIKALEMPKRRGPRGD